ncbi:MAG TPA: flagellar basal body rod C-terminal domain-containing protein [Tepidisphaeraceae bacterium]|nr:flagellar basal body rod C-terminal domain-containing protein [Tepidisphaeraceae bacterium]
MMVRRAATFGLKRIQAAWAMTALYRAFLEDPEWYVRSAAQQAFQEIQQDEQRGPRAYPPVEWVPWLATWTAAHGEDVPSGDAAWDMLTRALHEGEPQIRTLAAATIGQFGETRLTRDGRMLIDNQGFVIAGDDTQARLLGSNQQPIRLQGFSPAELRIDSVGRVLRAGTSEVLATIGVFKPMDPSAVLLPVGNAQMQIWADNTAITPIEGVVRSGFVERSNVDPATEMVRLIEAQRQLEANANMIRYQDQATGRLVAEVGKIG